MAQLQQKNTAKGKQVDLAQEIRRQKQIRRRGRRIAFGCGVLALLAYLSGVFTAMVSVGSTWYESASIALVAQAGYPAQTGLSSVYQIEPLSGGFVVLGTESCLVYSNGGNRLRSIQSGYLRPAIAAGSSRYLLYQRAGTELRIESRTKTIYTKTYTNNILLAAMANNGNFAVVTESDRYLASLTMYSANMTELLTYSMTDSEGIPLCMEYAADNKTLAMATIFASGGQMQSNLYLVCASDGSAECIASEQATPLALEWVSKTQLLVLYDSKAVLYDTTTQQQLAQYDYGNQTMADYAVYDGQLALLLTQGNQSEAVLLQNMLADASVIAADAATTQIVLDDQRVYLVSEREIASYTYAGVYIDVYQSESKIVSLALANELLLFTANEVALFTPPSLP